MFSLTCVLPNGNFRRVFWGSVLVAGLISCAALLITRPAGAQTGTIVQHDFEDGTAQGWVPRGGGVVLTNTTEAAATGIRSLKTTGRTQGFHGPSLNILNTLVKGATYQVTVSVRLVAGQAPTTIRVTVQRTPTGGANQFDTVVSSANNGVTDASWVTLTGLYSYTTDVTGLLLYVEATTATSSYYIDNFTITQLAPPPGPPGNTTGASSTFETNTREGWAPRIGDEILTVTSADQHSGTYSLRTSGRNSAFRGPSFNVTNVMFNGSRYRITLWAKLAPGEANTQLRVSLQRNLGSFPSTFHTVIPNTTVTANGWVRLAFTYDLALANTSLTLYVESSAGTASFYIDDFQITYVPPPVAERDIPSVYQSVAAYFPVGAAVWQGDLTGEHAFLLTKHFNSLTSENDMKWGTLQPTEGTFNFAPADAQVNFAKANNMSIRGHTLVWHNQNPAWLFNDANGQPMTPTPENKALLLQRLRNHIQTVITHYRNDAAPFGNDVFAWDVVNEVIDPGQPDGFRRSQWFNITGTDYIDEALRAAREFAPNAKLYINDFDTTNTTKRQFLRNLIVDLQSRGVPIDGIGHQMHNNVDFPSGQSIIDTINMFHDLGIDNQITELDVSIYSNSFPNSVVDYSDIPADRFLLQGYRYRTFFDAFRQLQGKISSITFWGQADDHTWLTSAARVNGPLLFDTSLRKKHAYWGIIDPLQLPGADVSASISADTATVESGQAVAYNILVKNNRDNDVAPYLPSDDDLPAANVSLVSAIPGGTTFQSLTAPADWNCSTPLSGETGQVQCTTTTLAVDASAQFTLKVEVACQTADGLQLDNFATATSTTLDPNTAPNNTASTTIQVSNPPPAIKLIGTDPMTVECHTSFSDPGATAADACDGSVPVTTTGSVDVNVPGSYILTYTAQDAAGTVATHTRTVNVVDTIAPVVDLNDLTILLPGLKIIINGQMVTINGQTFTIGSRTVTLFGHTITFNGSTITIDGQTFTISGQTIMLVPPNGQYQTLTIADLVASVSDGCDSALGSSSVVITQVSSDELENAPGNSDGNTTNDIVIAAGCKSVRLRAERDSNRNGRVYTVTLRVRDASGNTTTKTAKVTVPRGQGIGAAVDDGPHYTVMGCP
jgi:endo-1,4-beta-xylanase